jgi:hypothetical protein
MNYRYLQIVSFLVFATLGAIPSPVVADDGIEWEHLRIIPTLTVSESYSDNIYLSDRNKTDDYFTTITPEVVIDAAIAPRNYFSLKYHGDFFSYSNDKNFRQDHHLGSLSFNSKTAKGSHFIAGITAQDTAVQPFAVNEKSKDYIQKSAYADILLSLGTIVEIGTEYSKEARDFYSQKYADDDFKRDTWDLHLLYARSQVWPLLLQYRYINQDNDDRDTINTDFQSHTLFMGGRWRPAGKLSGALRAGYMWAKHDESDAQDYDGYAVDTDLNYTFSEVTQFTLTAERLIRQPTRSARESGEYYVSTSAGMLITHRMWEKITTRLNIFYRETDYKELQSSENVRQDDYYRAGLSITYSPLSPLSISIGYYYQDNDSNIEPEDYTENLLEFGIALSM